MRLVLNKPKFVSRSNFMGIWVALLLILLPIVNYPFVPQGYEIAKFIFWEIWWVGLVSLIIIGNKYAKLLSFDKTNIKLGWLFIIILGVTAIAGGEISILGSVFRKQGWIFFFQLWVFYLVMRKIDKISIKKSLYGLRYGILFTVIVSFIQLFSGWARTGSTFGEPNSFGGYLAISIPLIIDKYYWWLGIWAAVGILLAQSRSAIVSILAGGGFMIFRLKQKINKILFGLIISSLFWGTVYLFSLGNLRVSSVDNRFQIWQLAIRAILANPILGYGADNIQGVLNKFITPDNLGSSGLVIDRSHFLLLDIWLWSGILGVLSFAGWIVYSIWFNINDKEKTSLIAAILIFLVFTAFNPPSITMWVLFYFAMAILDNHNYV